jgi:hypothetical protein
MFSDNETPAQKAIRSKLYRTHKPVHVTSCECGNPRYTINGHQWIPVKMTRSHANAVAKGGAVDRESGAVLVVTITCACGRTRYDLKD